MTNEYDVYVIYDPEIPDFLNGVIIGEYMFITDKQEFLNSLKKAI